MYRFRELAKAAKKETEGKEYRLAVLGNCATQFLAQTISGYAHLESMNLKVHDADYNQIEAQLIDPGSETYGFDPDYILLYLAPDKLYEEFMELKADERSGFADSVMQRLSSFWDMISGRSKAEILQMGFSEIDDRAFGNFGNRISISFNYQLRKLNWLLEEAESKRAGIYPVDLLSIQISLGNERFYDPVLYYNAKVNIALDSWGYVARQVYEVTRALQGHVKKCVVLDLDNTLWGGVIGDYGLAGIEIGELGRGHVFTDLQLWLKQLKDRGIL
ncbi:MAG: FkbH domain-containing protein, partial [Lachnospiraceae bacterium]|nr:FkbH domain-containing protein [Lachnospiraceae bacterium]